MRALVVTAVLLSSSSALPCSIFLQDLFTGTYLFEGRTIPRNAELRVRGFDTRTTLPLTRPDGALVEAVVDSDDITPFLVVDGLLDPGEWSVTIADPAGALPARTVTFTVTDDVDNDAPVAPDATASRATEGSLDGDSCQPAWPTDVVHIGVAGDDPLAVASRDGERRGVGFLIGADLSIEIHEDEGGEVAYDVVVRDFAGNESEPTTVSTWAGCAGGCASSSALPATATLLLLLRRRRRSLGG